MTNPIEVRCASLRNALAGCRGNRERLAWLVEQARLAPGLPDFLRTPDRRIQGCLSNLWIACDHREGRCHFACDSDSLVVKAVALAICEIHNGSTPEEILAFDPASLTPLGITQHLTPNRRNALSRILDEIRSFAQNCLALAGKDAAASS